MKIGKQETFTTADLYLSAFILSTIPDIDISFTVQSGRTLFVFPASNELYQAMGEFNSGGLVNGFNFTQNIKKLRTEMLIRKRRNTDGRLG